MADDPSQPPGTMAALGQVMGELVHDLANEVQVLHGWALLARGEAAVGHPAESEIDRVVELSSDLVHMLRDVLTTLAGQGTLPEALFEPGPLTEAVLSRQVRGMAVELRLRSRLPPGVRVRGRPTFWTRAVGNLVRNAARHARSAVQVQLQVDVDDAGRRWVVARVEDDGPGVAAEARESIFQPLWRGEGGGSGLGLSAVTWLVGQLDGRVRYVEGGALGGAAFELAVPAAGAQAPVMVEDPPPGERPVSLAGLRLLVVDANAESRRALRLVLRRTGAEVRELDPLGASGDELVSAVLGAVPDLVLLDLASGAGGAALWDRLRRALPTLADRVAFVTGSIPGHPERDAALATGRPVLTLPLDAEQVARALAERIGAIR